MREEEPDKLGSEAVDSGWDGILWAAVPKKRPSISRQRLRMTHKWLKNRQDIVECSACGGRKLAHHLCPNCLLILKRFMRLERRDASTSAATTDQSTSSQKNSND